MNTEQERADFEAWYRDTYNSTLYCEFRFEGWQAGRAALQSQVNSEAADRVREFLDNWLKIRLNDKTVVYQLNDLELRVDDLRALLALHSQDREDAERYRLLRRGQKWSVIDGIGNELRAEGLDAAIDHARRIEGEV